MKLGMDFRLWRSIGFAGLLAGVLVAGDSILANAAMDTASDWGEQSPVAFNFDNDTWEAGLGAGYSFAIGPRKISQDARDNLVDFFNDPDTVALLKTLEFVTFEGDLHNAVASNAHLFRRVSPMIACGLEVGYEYHNINYSLPPVYFQPNARIPNVFWHSDILQITPSIKVGPSKGHWRPYVSFGAGMALVHESFFLDNGPFPIEGTDASADWNVAGDRRDLYFTTTAALGMDFALPYNYSAGINAKYSQIFAPNPKGGYMFIIPSAHLDYHF